MNEKVATIVAFFALFVALVGNATTLHVASTADTKLCLASAENRNKIREQIASGDPKLLKPGDPGYTYYAAHPDEKAALSRIIRRSLARFPAIDCR